jgi:hypothetical protein
MIEILLECRSKPEQSGYHDTIIVCIDNHLRYSCDAGSCPNGPTGKRGWLAPCTTKFSCIQHYRYGKCLLLNGAAALPSRVSNSNHDGNYILTEVFIHKGYSATNRGSRGCPTIHPVHWLSFLENFKLGDTGIFTLIDVVPDADSRA